MRDDKRAGFNAHSSPIFKTLEILKIQDQIILLNCLFVHDSLNGKLPKSFENTFLKLSDIRYGNTVSTTGLPQVLESPGF